ncbi:unnamed protein product [Bathycoccus prasinos]
MMMTSNADQNRDDKVSRGNNITPIKIRKVIPKTEDRREKTTTGNHQNNHHQEEEDQEEESLSPTSRSRSMTEDDDQLLLNSRGQSPRRSLQFTTVTSNNSRDGSSVASSEEDLQVANGERIRGESSSSGKNENDSDENAEERTTIMNNGGDSKQNQGIKSNVVQRMGRCSSTSSMISSTAKTDEYGLQTKPCTVARLDGYCYGFPVNERKEKAYSKARKQLMKQKDRASESYARYSKARKVWKEAKRTSGSSGSSVTNVTNSAINEALNQCQREVARNGLPEKKRAKAWLDALSVKSKRDNCEKTYEEYSQLSERERFDRERASVRVDLINVFPDHPRYSLGAIDSMKERNKESGGEEEEEGGEEDQKIQHELITESLDRLRSSSSARGQSSMTSSGNESSSGGEMHSNSASPRFSQHQNHIQAMNSFGGTFVGSPPRSPHGLRGFKKEDDDEGDEGDKGDALKRTTSSESGGISNDRDDTADTTNEEPQNAIMQLLTGSFFEKLSMFPARVSSIKEEEGREEGKKRANNNNNNDDEEDEEEDDEDQFRLPENYMDSTSLQYFGKMERVLMAFSARSPRDLEKSHVVAAAMSLLVFIGNEENAFWTLVCLAEDVNLFLDEAEVTTETIVLEERTRHNSSLERVHTNLVGKIFTRIGAGFFPPNVVLRILDAIILSPPPLSSRLLHHIAYEFLFHHGEKLKDEERTLEIATEAFDCDELIINGMKMMSATETMKSNSSLRILARQRVERSSGGFCGPDKGWSVSLVSAKRMKNGDVSSKKKKMFVPTSGWSSDEDEAIRKATRSCDFFGHFSPLRNRRKSQDDFLREEEKKQQSRSVQEVVNEINESGSELERKKSEDPLMMTLSPVKTIPSQGTLNESADIMRYKFVIRGPNDVTCTMYRNRADLVRLHEILCERKITAQLSMLRLPKSFTNKLTAGITKSGFNESQEYFVRLSKAGVPGLQKVFEEFFELDSPDLNEYCYESDDTQGSFDDY